MTLIDLHDKDLNGILIVETYLCDRFKVEAFTLYPYIFLASSDMLDFDKDVNRVRLNHERIHLCQQKKARKIKPNSLDIFEAEYKYKQSNLFMLKLVWQNRKMLLKYWREYRKFKKAGYNMDMSYRLISYEREAYKHENVGYYLNLVNK